MNDVHNKQRDRVHDDERDQPLTDTEPSASYYYDDATGYETYQDEEEEADEPNRASAP